MPLRRPPKLRIFAKSTSAIITPIGFPLIGLIEFMSESAFIRDGSSISISWANPSKGGLKKALESKIACDFPEQVGVAFVHE